MWGDVGRCRTLVTVKPVSESVLRRPHAAQHRRVVERLEVRCEPEEIRSRRLHAHGEPGPVEDV